MGRGFLLRLLGDQSFGELCKQFLDGHLTIQQEANRRAGAFGEHTPKQEIVSNLPTAELGRLIIGELQSGAEGIGIVVLDGATLHHCKQLGFDLDGVELSIVSTYSEELFVRPLLDDLPSIDDTDDVCVDDGREAVGDDDGGTSLH